MQSPVNREECLMHQYMPGVLTSIRQHIVIGLREVTLAFSIWMDGLWKQSNNFKHISLISKKLPETPQ